jgi:hypothetical protein
MSNTSHTITIRIPQDLARWLEQVAVKAGVSQGKIVRDQLERARAGDPGRAYLRLAGSINGPKDLSKRKGYRRA